MSVRKKIVELSFICKKNLYKLHKTFFPLYSFDLLTSFSAMHWVEDQKAALQNMSFCLKIGGIALMTMVVKPDKAFFDGKYLNGEVIMSKSRPQLTG